MSTWRSEPNDWRTPDYTGAHPWTGIRGFTYEAAEHCIRHAIARFGEAALFADETVDAKGDPLHPIFSWDECADDLCCAECVGEDVALMAKIRSFATLRHGEELHYTGPNGRAASNPCTRTIGPRGGITEKIIRVRVSGAPKTWKRDPRRLRVPVKYGLYESTAITESNLNDWHRAADCPLNR